MIHHDSPQRLAEMQGVEGDYARHARIFSDRGGSEQQLHAAILAHGLRAGLDESVTAPYKPLCQNCQRRGASWEFTQRCIACEIGWGVVCLAEAHDEFSRWTAQQGVPGMNCPYCNQWLAALGNVGLTPASIEYRVRVMPTDIVIGSRAMDAFRWMVQWLLPEHAPATAEHLVARIGDSPDTIPAGDKNALYTAILHAESVFNALARGRSAFRVTREQRANVLNLVPAIKLIAAALLASDHGARGFSAA